MIFLAAGAAFRRIDRFTSELVTDLFRSTVADSYFSPYDYCVQPGDVIRLRRDERIWLSTDTNVAAEIYLTSAYVERHGMIFGWLARAYGGMLRSVLAG